MRIACTAVSCPKPSPGPGIAQDWTLDGLTYTFTINPNAKFSDGTDLTADDVAFTITGFLAPDTASPNASKFTSIAGADEFIAGTADSISGLEVVDPKTLKITLGTPDASFLFNLRYIFTVPKAALDGKNLTNDPWFNAPVGAGPFIFESWTNGGDFVAKKNPTYYQEGKPALDGFIREMKVRFPDATARAPVSPEMSRGEPVHTGSLPALARVRRIELTKQVK